MNVLYTLIIYPITLLIELVFIFSQKVFKEPVISIFAISIVVNLLCLPLYDIAEKWQRIERETARRLKPKINRIRTVFSGDERFMILQTFYRQNNYHPVYALRSTFGLLIQIPFFIAAYSFLSHLDLPKGSSFLFIPDLGAPDRLLSPWEINLLPLLMTAINIISGALYTRGFPLKDKIQLYGMAAFFLVLLYNSPAGIVIYWTMNNLFSLIKNIYYTIPFKNKKKILSLLFSPFFLFISFYLLRVYNGSFQLRLISSVFFIILAIFSWLPFFNRRIFWRKKSNPAWGGSFQADFYLFLVSFITLCALAGLFLPSMLIAASPQEFSFIDSYTTPLFFIGNSCLQAAGLLVLWPVFLYFLFDDKIKAVLSFLAPVFLFCSLLNIFIFPGNYGIISLELVFDNGVNHTMIDALTNFTPLFFVMLIVFLLFHLRREKILLPLSLICLVSITGYSIHNIIQINNEFQKVKGFRAGLEEESKIVKPLFHLSKTGKNTIIIILDQAISVFVPFIFGENPELNNVYSGFTYFPNTVSFNMYTRIAAPSLFGGYEYSPLEINRRETVPLVTKHNESLLLMPRIFSEAGYSVTVTDPPFPNYSDKEDLSIYDPYPDVRAIVTDSRYTRIWLNEHDMNFPTTADVLKHNLFIYSLLKIAPLAFRQGIYLHGDYFSSSPTQNLALTLNGYAVLDYLPEFTGFDPEKENTAILIVNNTTHEHSFLQAPDYRPVSVVTDYGKGPFSRENAYHVNAASIKRIGEWFDFLKTAGVYDNTRIILASDHGKAKKNSFIKTPIPFNIEQVNALLMVKDFNSRFSMKTDFSFMTNADVPFLAFEGQIEKPVNPFTGNEITINMKSSPLYITVSASNILNNSNTFGFTLDPKKDYYVHNVNNNIFDPTNWELAASGQ
jgi:YidC/Oxa1 family membrane protein insertase